MLTTYEPIAARPVAVAAELHRLEHPQRALRRRRRASATGDSSRSSAAPRRSRRSSGVRAAQSASSERAPDDLAVHVRRAGARRGWRGGSRRCARAAACAARGTGPRSSPRCAAQAAGDQLEVVDELLDALVVARSGPRRSRAGARRSARGTRGRASGRGSPASWRCARRQQAAVLLDARRDLGRHLDAARALAQPLRQRLRLEEVAVDDQLVVAQRSSRGWSSRARPGGRPCRRRPSEPKCSSSGTWTPSRGRAEHRRAARPRPPRRSPG